MHVLITGGAGFLGSVLVPKLLGCGHTVHVIDNFQHGVPSLLSWCYDRRLTITNHDVRKGYDVGWMACADVIVPLAALVGAPICERDPTAAITVNERAIHALVQAASPQQFIIYPNTNSGYGIGSNELCTEDSPLNPISVYGRTKVMGEENVLQHPNSISFRFATLFGGSPRMRLDLLVNDFVFRAVKDRAITLFEAEFRRNYLHVRDAAEAIIFAIHHPGEMMRAGRVFNAGLSSANFSKRQLCAKIAQYVPELMWNEAKIGEDPDKRDYVVSNARLEGLGWRPSYTVDDGILELIKAFTCPFSSQYSN